MDRKFYVENRRRAAAYMADNDAMLFFSGEGVQKTANEDYPFFANRNFLYLTGIKQEQSALLLQKIGDEVSECLFVTKPDSAREIWTGRRLRDAEIQEISGMERVEDINDLNGTLGELLAFQNVSTLWFCFDAFARERSLDIEREFAHRIRNKYPDLMIKNSYPLLAAMRRIKAPAELDAIRKAMQITEAGTRRMMRVARPGMMEYQLEAEFNSELVAHGQRHTAFPSIIAGGERIFYLHYENPVSMLSDGELILTDVGATFDEYCTDVSRVFPANGHFSERQTEIYQIAYESNRAVMAQVHVGVPFSKLTRTCREVCFEGLKALGLLDDVADIGRYCWHGVVHHIGLNTHDVGGYDEPLTENMVFAVDAGIYVRAWGVGLRVEDNALVTADGCENLSAGIPSTVEEIESLLASARRPETNGSAEPDTR